MLDSAYKRAFKIREDLKGLNAERNKITQLLDDTNRYIEGVVRITITTRDEDDKEPVLITNRHAIKAVLEGLHDDVSHTIGRLTDEFKSL